MQPSLLGADIVLRRFFSLRLRFDRQVLVRRLVTLHKIERLGRAVDLCFGLFSHSKSDQVPSIPPRVVVMFCHADKNKWLTAAP